MTRQPSSSKPGSARHWATWHLNFLRSSARRPGPGRFAFAVPRRVEFMFVGCGVTAGNCVIWVFSSAGRAPRLHRGCHRFDPGRTHSYEAPLSRLPGGAAGFLHVGTSSPIVSALPYLAGMEHVIVRTDSEGIPTAVLSRGREWA